MVRRFGAIIFVAGTATLIGYLMLFTSYAPDAYVFVRYAAIDNTVRGVGISSLLDNNFLFDALSVVGDWLGFSTGVEYLLGITLLTLVVFVIKYSVLLRVGRLSDVMLLCAASFFVLELNQLRFNLALCLLLLGIHMSSRWRFASYAGSLLSHVIPLSLYVSQRAKYIPIVVLVPLLLVYLQGKSRLYDYVTANETGVFKSLLFIFPFIWCYVEQRFIRQQHERVIELGLSFALCGFLALAINTAVAARFFEMAFVLAAWSNVIRPLSYASRIVIIVFSCGALLSRSASGINAGPSNFTDEFKLSPKEFVDVLRGQ